MTISTHPFAQWSLALFLFPIFFYATAKPRVMIPLMSNRSIECLSHCPFPLAWTINVHTGKERFGGTDSNVFIRLFNSRNEQTSEYQLSHYNWQPSVDDFPLRNLFEIGALDRFRILTEDIGSVSKIHVSCTRSRQHVQREIVSVTWYLLIRRRADSFLAEVARGN